nr:Chain P, SspB-tail peptide [synthetic construct]2DS8_Q Chain Q, SspB-tail peptide [synthetic construct]
APALRVVK